MTKCLKNEFITHITVHIYIFHEPRFQVLILYTFQEMFLVSRCEPSTMVVLKKLVSRMTENTVL